MRSSSSCRSLYLHTHTRKSCCSNSSRKWWKRSRREKKKKKRSANALDQGEEKRSNYDDMTMSSKAWLGSCCWCSPPDLYILLFFFFLFPSLIYHFSSSIYNILSIHLIISSLGYIFFSSLSLFVNRTCMYVSIHPILWKTFNSMAKEGRKEGRQSRLQLYCMR